MFTRSEHGTGSVFAASALLIGSVVGAGIFALPYVISQSGYGVGLVYLIVLGFIMMYVNLAYGEVVLSTKGKRQMPSYVGRYLSKPWKWATIFSMFVGFYGALAAYLLEIGNLGYKLLGDSLGGTPLVYSLACFVCVSAALFYGLRAVTAVEKIMVTILIGLVIVLGAAGIPYIETSNLATYTPSAIFLPYGVVLFAYAAAGSVVDMKDVLHKQRHKLKKSIIIGSLIPIGIYILFATVVVGINGVDTTESAVVGLGNALGKTALQFGSLFGIISMLTSFLLVGLILKEVYQYDMKQKPALAWLFVVVPPLLVVLLNWLTFIEILGISGAVIGGVTGIVLIRLHAAMKKDRDQEPEYTVTQSPIVHGTAYVVFALGMVYEFYAVLTRWL